MGDGVQELFLGIQVFDEIFVAKHVNLDIGHWTFIGKLAIFIRKLNASRTKHNEKRPARGRGSGSKSPASILIR